MKEAWKALLRAIRDVIKWALRIILKPVVASLNAITELASGWSKELDKF